MNPIDGSGIVPVVAILFIAIVGFVIIASIVSSIATSLANDASPVETQDVTVVSKRGEVQGQRTSTYTNYFATFESADGVRREFALKGKEYGLLMEGDHGRLTFQGTRYKGFDRPIA